MATTEAAPLDAAKLEQFVFRAVDEVGATVNAALVVMGDRLGLYRAPAAASAGTSTTTTSTTAASASSAPVTTPTSSVRGCPALDGIVEPAAGDRVEDNFNPVGRAYYGFSTLLCTPASLSQDVGLALGAQAGPAKIRDVVEQAGFGRFRAAAETPFNLVFEARA